MKKNLIIIMIDGGRLDYAQNSHIFEKLKSNSCFLSQSITYAPHTIAAMHATFSGSYGTRTGTNSYWSTNNFKKNDLILIIKDNITLLNEIDLSIAINFKYKNVKIQVNN